MSVLTQSLLRALSMFFCATLAAAAQQAPATVTESTVVEATVDQLQAWMKSGRLTSRRLTEIYLSRIDRYDRHGPRINSLLEVNPQALQIADSLDRERHTKGPRSALHGIPVILKDAIATADQLRTSNGSYWLMDATPTHDATVARKLKDAGALILAKGNMDEMACCNGVFSGRGGAVRNPYDLDRFSSGSSSGPAAAISTNLGVVSIGGDTRSSIRFPASVTSIVGLKPTMGLISRAGVIPGDVHLDVVGPMARTVTDVAIATGLLTGVDPRDYYTRISDGISLRDYRPFLKRGALRGARIGIARDGFFGLNASIDSVMETALAALRQEGAILVDSIPLNAIPFAGGRADDAKVLNAASALALDQYLKDLTPDSPVRSRAQLRAAALLNPFPSNFGADYGRGSFSVDTGTTPLAEYTLDNPKVRAAFEKFINEQRGLVMTQMEAQHLDAIVFPTTSTLTDLLVPPTRVSDPGSTSRGKPEIANYSGLPEITVPAGYTGNGFPVGMSLLGSAFSEGKLLGLAYAFEQATHSRRPPNLAKAPTPINAFIPDVPANDAFANRMRIEGASGSVSGSLLMAGVEFGEPRTSARPIDRTVWFSYVAERDGQLTIDDAGSLPSRNDLVVYGGGTSLDRLESPTRGRRSTRAGPVQVSISVKAGTTYLIVLGTDANSVKGGRYVLNWRLDAAR
jgi:amidase